MGIQANRLINNSCRLILLRERIQAATMQKLLVLVFASLVVACIGRSTNKKLMADLKAIKSELSMVADELNKAKHDDKPKGLGLLRMLADTADEGTDDDLEHLVSFAKYVTAVQDMPKTA